MWTKEDALKYLTTLIAEIEKVATSERMSSSHTRWLANTLTFLEEVFGQNSTYFLSISSLRWSQSGVIFLSPLDPDGSREHSHNLAFQRDLQSAKGLLEAAYDHLLRSDLRTVYNGKNTGPESSTLIKVINLMDHKLRKVIRTTPTKEKEIQDAIENLFVGADIQYSRETDSIEYSSKTYIPDFSLEKIDLAVEVKLCAKEGREKEIIAEINDDILAYKTKYGNQLFVVYDVGQIRDRERFCGSFEIHGNVVVKIIKH